MSTRHIHLIARLTLAAILVVHLRLNVLAETISVRIAQSAAASPCCCGGSGVDNVNVPPDETPPLHGRSCPLCPKQGCSECCILCIYAKAPCHSVAIAVTWAEPTQSFEQVPEAANHIPPAPVEEFFQPPRV